MNMCDKAERPLEEYLTTSCGAGLVIEEWGEV